MRLFTFVVLEALLSPITLTGYSLMMLWALTISQQKDLSVTALSPLFCRWLLHLQGIRPDLATDRLMTILPSLNTNFNWAAIGPTLLAMNISGYTPTLFNVPTPGEENLGNMINTRTLFFDRALESALTTVEQVVILGAGFDTRLFKFCTQQGLSLFEVDQVSTQSVKIQALRKSGIDLDTITFVSVNFNQEDWVEKLISNGFMRGKKTFFLWEGVTYYLTEAVVIKSLQAMAEVSGKGSAVAFDFFSQQFIQGEKDWTWLKPALGILDWIGEPFRFGLDITRGEKSAAHSLIEGTGFQLDTLQVMGTANQKVGFGGLMTITKY